jgi:magnesium-transporting ATPase (P-type)
MIGIYLTEWLALITTGVAIVVVAVPEGLPLAVMISLAFSIKRMLVD